MGEDTRYAVNLAWSQSDNAFLAAVPDLPGCIADGETRSEAIAAVEVVIAEWIETAKELGAADSGTERFLIFV